MNAMLKKAHEMMENEMMENVFKGYVPELEVGEVCEMQTLWDGKGDCPRDSYSYPITDNNWINYVFEVIEEKEDELDNIIKITGIELL